VQEGRFPKEFERIVTEKYLGAIPKAPFGMKIAYDAATAQPAW